MIRLVGMGRTLAWCVVSALTLGCASGSPSGPGVDRSKKLNTLTTSDIRALCDWAAQQQGGYGTVVLCDASINTLQAPRDQASCVALGMLDFGKPTCSQTVDDWTRCAQWLLANWCTTTPSPRPAICDVMQTACFDNSLSTSADAGTD